MRRSASHAQLGRNNSKPRAKPYRIMFPTEDYHAPRQVRPQTANLQQHGNYGHKQREQRNSSGQQNVHQKQIRAQSAGFTRNGGVRLHSNVGSLGSQSRPTTPSIPSDGRPASGQSLFVGATSEQDSSHEDRKSENWNEVDPRSKKKKNGRER